MAFALFVKIGTPAYPEGVWRCERIVNDDTSVNTFEGNVIEDMKATKDDEVKTISYRVVDLDGKMTRWPDRP